MHFMEEPLYVGVGLEVGGVGGHSGIELTLQRGTLEDLAGL